MWISPLKHFQKKRHESCRGSGSRNFANVIQFQNFACCWSKRISIPDVRHQSRTHVPGVRSIRNRKQSWFNTALWTCHFVLGGSAPTKFVLDNRTVVVSPQKAALV